MTGGPPTEGGRPGMPQRSDRTPAPTGGRGEAGHRLLAHTADITIEAWGPSRSRCLAEAVLGLVSAFAEVSDVAPVRSVVLSLPAPDDETSLVRLLEEVIFLVEVQELVPVGATVNELPGGGLRATLPVIPLANATAAGPVPKGVAYHGLTLACHGGQWRCTATIDV